MTDSKHTLEELIDIAIREAFQIGLRTGITRFAWWKDGRQQVGTCGTSLEEALSWADKLPSPILRVPLDIEGLNPAAVPKMLEALKIAAKILIAGSDPDDNSRPFPELPQILAAVAQADIALAEGATDAT